MRLSSAGITPRTAVLREAHVLWGFLRYDLVATLVPSVMFLVAALITWQAAPRTWVIDAARWLGYFVAYTLVLTIPNQILGMEEDRVNKPDRPLPQGVLTPHEAWIQWRIAVMLFLSLGLWFGLLWPTLFWLVLAYLYNQGGWSQVWWKRQMAMGGAVLAQLSAAWALAGPPTALSIRWVVFLSMIMPFVIPLADLRDIAGDRAIERQTLPLHWGEAPTRRYLAICFLLLPFATAAWMIAPIALTLPVGVMAVVLALISWLIAYRLLKLRTPHADQRTYTLFTCWYVGAVATATILTGLIAGGCLG